MGNRQIMIVSHEHKYIFFHVQKNAGSSIREVLMENYGGVRMRQHAPAVIVQEMLGGKIFNEYYKFAVVRNPYSRVVSWYNVLTRKEIVEQRKTNKPRSFEDMIQNQTHIYNNRDYEDNELWRSQWNFLSIDGELHLDYIIRYENLLNGYDNLDKSIFNKSIPLPHIKNWGSGNDWEKYYTPELKEIIYKRFKIDFQEFNYAK